MEQGREFTCAQQAGLFSLAWRVHHKHLGTEKPTETVILCWQPVLITPCCQSLFMGGQSRRAPSLSEKSQLAPDTEQPLEVFEAQPEKCTWESQSASSKLICHPQSIKAVVVGFYLSWFEGFFFQCAVQVSSIYKCTTSSWLGINHECSADANIGVLEAWPSEPTQAFIPLQLSYVASSHNGCLYLCDFTVC